jgi:HlyD family secretion protein
MPNTESLWSEAKTRRPGARRQGIVAAIVAISVVLLAVVGFVAAKPRDAIPLLRNPAAAKVERRSLRDIVSAAGTLELSETESVTAPEKGNVVEILVEEGDSVKVGQLLFVIDDSSLQDELGAKRASLSKLLRESEQADAVAGFDARSQALSEAKSRRELGQAEAERNRVAALVDRKLAAQSELDSAESKLQAARESLDSLLLQKERSETLYRIAAQNRASDRKLLEEDIADLEERVAACKVRAAMPGVVYSIAARQGKTATQSEELAVVASPSSLRAAVDIPETRAAAVKPGAAATVYVGETPVPGVVTYMASYATSSSSSSGATVRAHLGFPTLPAGAVVGSSVTAEIVVGEVADALVLPRGPYLTSGDYAVAYVVSGSVARKREVDFGTADGQVIEVAAGLEEGDIVLTGNYAEYIHLDEVKVEGVKIAAE